MKPQSTWTKAEAKIESNRQAADLRMSRPTHTPTPWKTNGSMRITDEGGCQCVALTASGRIPYFNSLEEQKQNANFICRAVNSHEALLEALKGLVILRDREDVNDTFHEELLAAEKAIAKAEGR